MIDNLAGTRIAVVGGCGHVGLPLGVSFTLAGAQTVLIDIDDEKIRAVNEGRFPFLEHTGDEMLRDALDRGLEAANDPSRCHEADVVVFVVGTPVDEHLNPKLSDVLSVFDAYQPYFRDDALIVMRSTLFPGTMEYLHSLIQKRGIKLKLAFCPERVAQGQALVEIHSLPQIVSAFDEESFEAAYRLFAPLAPEIIRLTPLEAEVTKLMANAWRYLEFAIANQFYMIAESKGVDFYKIYQAIRWHYPRAEGYKSPGLTAGPCLFKDTMQLASYFDHQFYLGHSAMLVNESLATFVVERAGRQLGQSLWGKTIGLLGMAFKANSDDMRESLSFRVKKGFEFKGAKVVYHDPYITDCWPLEEVLDSADLLVLCAPHAEYRAIETTKPIVDVWGVYDKPELEVLPGRGQEAEAASPEQAESEATSARPTLPR